MNENDEKTDHEEKNLSPPGEALDKKHDPDEIAQSSAGSLHPTPARDEGRKRNGCNRGWGAHRIL